MALPCVASVVSEAGSAQSGLSVPLPSHEPPSSSGFNPVSCRSAARRLKSRGQTSLTSSFKLFFVHQREQ